MLPKNYWPKVLGSVVIQLYAGECTPSVDRAEIRTVFVANGSSPFCYLNARQWFRKAPWH